MDKSKGFVRTTFGGPVQKTTQEYQAMIADLVETLIAFAKRHDVSTDEYLQALAFLTEVGQSDEMILLGDAMHLSIAIDDMTHRGHDRRDRHQCRGPVLHSG